MTGVPTRLALFAALLVAVLGGSALAGSALGTDATKDDGGPHGASADHGDRGAAHPEGKRVATGPLPGLAVEQDGVTLTLDRPRLMRGAVTALSVRIEDEQGAPLRDLEVAHEKRLHLIVVRRDTKGFQHLHPEQASDGSWSARADLRRPGSYRVFADFTRGGKQRTLGTDLHVAGDFEPIALPAPADEVRDDRGLTVRRRVDGDRVAFDVLREGRIVNDELEPYLGAKGHLVTLRVGDLAYLHTHPEGGRLAFAVDLPSAGTYRSWVQFKLDGTVHTAAFTQEELR